jgi:hypothetical protein
MGGVHMAHRAADAKTVTNGAGGPSGCSRISASHGTGGWRATRPPLRRARPRLRSSLCCPLPNRARLVLRGQTEHEHFLDRLRRSAQRWVQWSWCGAMRPWRAAPASQICCVPPRPRRTGACASSSSFSCSGTLAAIAATKFGGRKAASASAWRYSADPRRRVAAQRPALNSWRALTRNPWIEDEAQKLSEQRHELSPIFGDGLKDQAAAVWD